MICKTCGYLPDTPNHEYGCEGSREESIMTEPRYYPPEDARALDDLEGICGEIHEETERQIDKWGVQEHPDGTSAMNVPLAFLRRVGVPDPYRLAFVSARGAMISAREQCEAYAAQDALHWADILMEEVMEAMAESDPQALREELLQVAAVCASWVRHIDNREFRDTWPDPEVAQRRATIMSGSAETPGTDAD